MFKKCELYYYDGLYLNEEEVKKLYIQKTDGIGLITALQKCISVYTLENGEKKHLDKKMLLNNAMKDNREFCYILKNNILVMLPIKVYYGIKNDYQVLAFWDDENIRDAMFDGVKRNGISILIADMAISSSMIDEYQKQLKLRKTYNSLNIN